MKSKFFSVMLFVVAVLFVGAIEAPQAADVDIDKQVTEQVVSLDQLSVDSAMQVDSIQFTPVMGAHYTGICSEADMDHQILELTIVQHSQRSDIDQMRSYLARSNLYDVGLLA